MRNRSENQVDLYFIRHGATPGNEEHRYIGRTDEGLSETGKKLLQQKASEMIMTPDLVLSSPMLRCRQSAQILFPDHTPVEITEWKEMDFGAFEGKNYKELNGNPDYQAWIDSGGTKAFPGGESREDFIKRGRDGMELAIKCIRQLPWKSELKVAAVVHGGTIMAILSSLWGGDYFSYQVKNGEGYHCRMKMLGDEVTNLH